MKNIIMTIVSIFLFAACGDESFSEKKEPMGPFEMEEHVFTDSDGSALWCGYGWENGVVRAAMPFSKSFDIDHINLSGEGFFCVSIPGDWWTWMQSEVGATIQLSKNEGLDTMTFQFRDGEMKEVL